MEKREGRKWVRAQFSPNSGRLDLDAEHKIEVATFDPNVVPAIVKVSTGMTLNLGNYESARVDCGVELPCHVEEIPKALEAAWSIAEGEIARQARSIRRG